MTNTYRLGFIFLASIGLMSLSGCTSSSTTGDSGALPNRDVARDIAPEIEGQTLADDKPLRLSQYRGKVVLLDFWAPWCQPCVAAIPHEKKVVAQFQDRPFAMIGVAVDGTKENLNGLLRKHGATWPNVLDEDNRIGGPYKVEVLPTFVLIDAQGKIAGRWEGAQDLPEIEKAIERELTAAEKKGAGGAE